MPEFVSAVGFLVGYAMVNAAARQGSAISPEAKAVQQSALSLVQSAEKSVALFGEKGVLISEIWSLQEECAEANWDAYQSEAIDPAAAHLAATLVRALPPGFPLPECSPEPDGAISLDWIEAPYQMFSISCSRSERLAYAWIDGSDRGHGVIRFDGITIPSQILQGITAILHKDNVAFRLA